MDSLKIRPIVRTDCSAIAKLIRELAEVKKVENYCDIKSQDLESDGFNHDPVFFHGVVAEIQGKTGNKTAEVIGVALYHEKYSTFEGQVMHLNTFVVSEKHRRQGVGSSIIKFLAKIASDKKYSRISLETSGTNEAGMIFFAKHGAVNLTKEEGWLNFEFSRTEVKKMLEVEKIVENIHVRPTEPKDCEHILGMIKELAEFEKMPDGPKLSVKDLQRDGFYKLHPCFYSFVAELTDPESEETTVIGYNLFFLTYDPFKGKNIHLEDLYVSHKHRTKGVGQLLFQALAQFVEDGYNGFTLECLDWNEKAIQFYDKLGGTNSTTGSKATQSYRFLASAIKTLAK